MQPKLSAAAWLLCFTASSCFATDWTTIIEKENYQIQVDIDSYKVEQSLPLMTIKTMYTPTQERQDAKKIVYFHTSVQNMQFNCAEPYYRITSEQLYDKSNQLVMSNMKASAFKKIKMGSNTFSIGQLTCQVHQMLGG